MALSSAYEIVQRERCTECGRPKWICQNEDPDVQYQMVVETCSAKKALDKYEKRRGDKDKKYEPPPGEIVLPVAYLFRGGDLATLRDPYYEAQNKRFKALIESRPKLPS